MENDDQSVTVGPISDKHSQTHCPHFRDSYGCSSLQVWEEDMSFDPWPKIVQQKHQEFFELRMFDPLPPQHFNGHSWLGIHHPLGVSIGGCFGPIALLHPREV